MRAGAAVPAALVELCRREHPRLVGTLGYLVGDAELAEDLAQEALLRLCREWERVRLLESPGGWVHRVAVNLARSALRSRTTRRRIDEHLSGSAPGGGGNAELADAVAVRSAVAALPERQRLALVLRYYADLPVQEVAMIMQCPQGTVKTLTSRAIESLRKMGLEAEA